MKLKQTAIWTTYLFSIVIFTVFVNWQSSIGLMLLAASLRMELDKDK